MSRPGENLIEVAAQVFFLLALLWGSRRAAASLGDELRVTVIATGFDVVSEGDSVTPTVFSPRKVQTPPPFRVPQETPPYLFESQGGEGPWEKPTWERQWEPYETPSFIRKKNSRA